jgi:hypothetical protein
MKKVFRFSSAKFMVLFLVLRTNSFTEGADLKIHHLNVMICWRWSQEKGSETLLYIRPLTRHTSEQAYNALASSRKFHVEALSSNLYSQTGEGSSTATILSAHLSSGHYW